MSRPYSGTIGAVTFEDGRPAGREQPANVRAFMASLVGYARRHSMALVEAEDGPMLVVLDPDEQPAPVDARDVSSTVVGTPLRDAAVDPRPGDHLPPTNAGKADPHGPAVVSPELHGSQGVRPVLPGPVEDAPAQEVAETADVAEATDVELAEPAGNAGKAEWVAYALARGGDPDAVGAMGRDALRDEFGSS